MARMPVCGMKRLLDIPLWPTVLVVFFSTVMLWLGTWQLGRAEEKRRLLALMAAGREQPVRSAEDIQSLPRFSVVSLSGHYLARPQWLLENKMRDKRVGYEVFTPFVAGELNRTVLVNRGWIAHGEDTDDKLAVDELPRRIMARVDSPPKTGIELGEVSLDENTPIQKMVYFSPDKLAHMLSAFSGVPKMLTQRVFLLDDAMPDGFVRDWKPVIMPPSRHVGYAVQWFGLTLTLWLLYFFWLRKGRG